jgi:hypothetical protein
LPAPLHQRPGAERARPPYDSGAAGDPVALLRALQTRQARIQDELRALEADLQRLLRALERR